MRHAFPLSSKDLRAFRTGPKVLALSIPKSGTHLLGKMLKQLPFLSSRWAYAVDETWAGILRQLCRVKNGQIVFGHLPWSKELVDVVNSEGFRVLFIVRDLRDVAVSDVHYVTSRATNHPLHMYFNSLSSDDERLAAWIAGVPAKYHPGGIKPKAWEGHTEAMLPWLDEPDCLTIRFEDLIGSSGGGTSKQQHDTISSIIKHLGHELSFEQITEIADKTFSSSTRTFRRGHIGDWEKGFNDGHKRLFKECRGEVLVRLGYEKDHDW